MTNRPTQAQIDGALDTLKKRIDEKIKTQGRPKLIAFDFSSTSDAAIFCNEIAAECADLEDLINPEMCARDYLHETAPKLFYPGEQ